MAQTYQCDLCQQVPCDFMVTTVNDGEVIAVGIECFEDWAMPIIELARQLRARAEQDQQAGDEDQGDDDERPDPAGMTNAEYLQAAEMGELSELLGEDEGPAEELVPPAEPADAEWEAEYPQRGKGATKTAAATKKAAGRKASQAAPPADVDG